MNINIINSSSLKRCPKAKLKNIVERVLLGENKLSSNILVILVNDDYILELNKKFLNHDYTTDVISFNFEDDLDNKVIEEKEIEDSEELFSEIYISTDTALKQAQEYKVSLNNELLRLAAHGTLHICGYDDSTETEANRMHELEDFYLQLNNNKK